MSDIKTNIDYKFVIAFALVMVVAYFILKPSKDKKEGRQDGKYTSKATGDKVKFVFTKNAFAATLKKRGFTKVENYLKTLGLTTKSIETTCKILKGTIGIFNDDEDIVYDKFRAIPNLIIFSIVNTAFFLIYKTELRDFLASFMSEKELNKIYSIIESKKS